MECTSEEEDADGNLARGDGLDKVESPDACVSVALRARPSGRARASRPRWLALGGEDRGGYALVLASVGRVQFFLARTRHTHETHRVYGEWTSE